MAERFEFANNKDRPGGPQFIDLNNVKDFGNDSVLSVEKSGWGMPQMRHLSTRSPDQDGVTIRDTQYNSRTVQLNVHIRSRSRDAFYRFRRELASRLRAEDNKNGLLRYTFPDGVKREIEARFVSGLAMSSQSESHGGLAFRDIIRFFCPSPFWYDPDRKFVSFRRVEQVRQSYPTDYPRSYARAGFDDSGFIYNSGDIDTFPEIVINGPGTQFVIRKTNLDGTVSSLVIDREIINTDTIIVDMGFGVRTVELEKGNGMVENIYHNFSGDFWSLHPGGNDITIDITGHTPFSGITINWYDRYLVA